MKRVALALAIMVLVVPACRSSASRGRGSAEELRLGVFPNLTHAPGLVGIGKGFFDDTLAPTKVKVSVFNSGSDAATALLGGSLDATYIGPVPSASLFVKSGKVAVVSGAASGGAALVARKGSGITGPGDLHGKKIAIPGIGNTQDVALRVWLHEQGLKTKEEGGDVSVLEVDNPELPQLFRSGDLDAAWEPEPWVSVLVTEGLADVLVDEASLWPGGKFVTTNLLVSTTYYDAHPDIIRNLVEANVKAIQFLNEEPEEARTVAVQQLEKEGAGSLPQGAVDRAFDNLTFTWDPIPSSLRTDAKDAEDLGYLEGTGSIDAIYRLDALNEVLSKLELPPVEVTS